jgi:peptidoglycan/LPS O-acetylase OafA/YrhL
MNKNASAAAEQLRAVDAGSTAGNEIGRAGKTHDALYGTTIGVLIAAMLAVVVFVYPTHALWLVGPSTVLYGVGVGVLGAVYRMRRKGTSRITAQRYRVGFFSTMALYVIGVALSVVLDARSAALPPWFWLPYVVVTALPMVIASTLGVPRER